MKITVQILILALCVLPALGRTEAIISLQDGSQLRGEVISMQDGVYTIQTPIIGTLQVQSNQITSISAGGTSAPANPVPETAPAGNANNAEINQKLNTMQTQLLADPQFIAEVQELVNDPEIVQLMSDPSIMQAVMARDVRMMESNPRAKELMANPKMQALIEKLQRQNSNQ